MKSQDPYTLLFTDEVLNDEKFEIDETSFSPQKPQLAYSHKNGQL